MKNLVYLALMSVCSLAYAEDRVPVSEISAGSYTCQNSDKEIIAQFYIRKDGTSAKVKVLSARSEQDGSGVEGCYLVNFKWLSSKNEVQDAYCCPTGSN